MARLPINNLLEKVTGIKSSSGKKDIKRIIKKLDKDIAENGNTIIWSGKNKKEEVEK